MAEATDWSRGPASSAHGRSTTTSPRIGSPPSAVTSPQLSVHRSPTTGSSSDRADGSNSSPPSSHHYGHGSEPYTPQAMLSPHVEAFSPTSIPAPPPLTIGSPRSQARAVRRLGYARISELTR